MGDGSEWIDEAAEVPPDVWNGLAQRAHDLGCGTKQHIASPASDPRDKQIVDLQWECAMMLNERNAARMERDRLLNRNTRLAKHQTELKDELAIVKTERDVALLERDVFRRDRDVLQARIDQSDRALQQKQAVESLRLQRAMTDNYGYPVASPCQGFGDPDPAPVDPVPLPVASAKPLPARALFCQTQAIGLVVR